MKRPLIGITPLFDDKKEIYFMRSGYTRGIEKAGGIPIMLPLTTDENLLSYFADQFDGFLFSGGHDLSASLYGEKQGKTWGDPVIERDQMEKSLLEKVLKNNKPVLGICRGIQMLNVVLGGNLYQDLGSEYPNSLRHFLPPSEEREKPSEDENSHWIRIERDSPLFELLEKELIEVNSYHHQALKRVADDLVIMARADDGVVEAVYAPNYYFVWGVQWHPELLFENDENASKLFKKFVEETAQHKEIS